MTPPRIPHQKPGPPDDVVPDDAAYVTATEDGNKAQGPQEDGADVADSAAVNNATVNNAATSTIATDLAASPHDEVRENVPGSQALNGDQPKVRNVMPVVGLGGSAGSLPALQQFFSHMPSDSGMAFVVILHLPSDHESNLPEILQHATAMPVVQVRDRIKVERNCVYVIPPDKHLTMEDGHIQDVRIDQGWGRRVAIDLFFRTLGESYGEFALGIILSGMASDGASGLKTIKERGGVTIAQEPAEAEFSDMPRNSIATGMVDWILPVAEMPQKLIEFRDNEGRIQLPAVEPPTEPADPEKDHETALRDVLAFLHTSTGNDFSHYKRATVLRRISRRLQVNTLQDLPSYLTFLRTHSSEGNSLLQDLLISVTTFFRDSSSFDAVQACLPQLFKNKQNCDHVRVWVAGCATGEEAYSMAILLHEYASRLDSPPSIQIFATDIDEQAIHVAREGRYPASIAADVSTERLQNYFVPEKGFYRVKKQLRDMVLFASHNLLRDSPFSRLDLVSCRNLMIYFGREAQSKATEIFHFALRHEGLLFLGSSEAIDEAHGLFYALDKRHRIFVRRPVARPHLPLPGTPLPTIARVLPTTLEKLNTSPSGISSDVLSDLRHLVSYGELHLRLLEQQAPPSVLVNENYDIVHLSERAGQFLHFAGGTVSINLLKVVPPALRLELRTALFRAFQNNALTELQEMPVEMGGETILVDIRVRPVADATTDQKFALVIFDQKRKLPDSSEFEHPRTDSVASHLDEELQFVKTHLRTTVEQYEASVEELRASNEELQAINEELRSAGEELETSKEELQSLNEELLSVNLELKIKIEEISRANSDLQNLMASTDIATIFLDRQLRIQRYTPPAVSLFNLIPTDLGRPLSDLNHSLNYDFLSDDARQVLHTLATTEKELPTTDDQWLLARMSPYRTADNNIDGVVLTFVDITRTRRAEQELDTSEQRFRVLVENVQDYAIFMTDTEGTVVTWNAGVERVLGFTEEEFIGQSGRVVFIPEDQAGGAFEQEMNTAALSGRALDERWSMRKNGEVFWASGLLTALRDDDGTLTGYAKILRDMTEHKLADEELQAAHAELEKRVEERTRELSDLNSSLQNEITERRQAEAERQKSEQARRDLLNRLVTAQEEERHRISRELHDQMGQQLAALLMSLKGMAENADGNERSAEAGEQFTRIQTILTDLMERVHNLAWELRPAALDNFGLSAALRQYGREWSARYKLRSDFVSRGMSRGQRLQPHVETALYRVVQEAMSNVQRHSEASNVSVLLERQEDRIVVIIEDDGQGFDVEAQKNALSDSKTPSRLGLVGMRERMEAIGGTLTIESAPGQGTTVYASAPLERRKEPRD